ncbi:TonB-dependent receptor [Adhaeribacter soli]|uniref:TonB-dependent receptor plug domain-containing protein n=1 Tax=Adhaeribacter soli TaxID=2607655 RepID=A0A5N1INC4_9BACT|nr:TonB-dependent receptor [Adhaeribacter soli]KAA9331238.1 TonB-dependent receptor plug domain-containing protein [Adhaeribacter soli]
MKANLLLILACIGISLQGFAQGTGTLAGKVTDKNTQEPVIGAVVFITGSNRGTTTDLDGNYSLKLQEGIYKIAVTYISYKQKTFENIRIEPGKTTTLNIGIEEDNKHLNAVTIVGTRQTNTEMSLISELKESEIVVSGVSGEQIAKSLDRDAAETVKRIPGVTVMNNKYIYIRGLSERYNTVMLNDALTPSTEVDAKAFSFDILPTSVIDRIMIYKGGSPELPGDFGGGVIKVYTKNFADENTTTLNLSGGYRSGTTFKDFSSYQGSNTDFLGFDNGYRALPNSFPTKLTSRTSPEMVEKLGRDLPNSWGTNLNSAAPDLRMSLGLTRAMRIGEVKISNISALSYSNTRQHISVQRNRYLDYQPGQPLESEFSYVDEQYNQNVRLGLIHNWGIRLNNNHKIEFRNLFNQLGSSEVIERNGVQEIQDNDIRSTALRYESRGIYSGQLQGTHNLNDDQTELTWTTGYSRTNRNEPDFRRARYQRTTGTNDPFMLYVPYNPDPQQTGRFYSELKENTYMAGGQVEQILGEKDTAETDNSHKIKVRAGFYAEHKNRDFDARWMSYTRSTNFDESIRSLPLGQVFQPQNINNTTGFILEEATKPTDHYSASSDILAAYVGTYIPFTSRFNLSGGLRVEYNRLQLDTRKSEKDIVKVDNPTTSFLPSLNFTYNLTERTMLRFNNSISVNRPEFRELAPFSYFDFQQYSEIRGNENLQSATIYNTDLRYEFYPNPTEAISFGVFYKYFQNPIESTIEPSSENPSYTFSNAIYSQNYGVETEIRKSLLDLFENKHLQNISLVLNASLIKSEVKLNAADAEVQEGSRPMMGQSPYIVNAGAYYQNEEKEFEVSLLYNVIGKRIYLVGNFQNPTIYEMPRHAIDLTISKKINNRFEVKGGIQDLLNQKVRMVQDTDMNGKINDIDSNIASYRRGAYTSLGLTYRF